MQKALDDWATAEPKLRALAQQLADGKASGAFDLDTKALAAPLPRAYQWADGSAYVVHVELVRKARGVEMPPSFWTDPLMYQGGSDSFIGPNDDIEAVDEAHGIDFEGEIGVIVDDVPMGVSPEAARRHIRLVTILNDVSLRNVIVTELAKGFGFFHGKPATAFAPVAVTPDELGDAWDGGKLNLPLISTLQRQGVRPSQRRHRSHLRFRPAHRPCRENASSRGRHGRRLGHRRQPRRRRRLLLHRRAARARDHRQWQACDAVHGVRRSHPHRNVRSRRPVDLRRHRPEGRALHAGGVSRAKVTAEAVMKLIGYFRSSAAFRVRIALNYKGLKVEHASRHLRKGEQAAPDYVALNPQKLVPALVLDSGEVLTQSLAILEYLEETHPEPPLLPKDPVGRARVRALSLIVSADIHPIQNLRVMGYLREKFGQTEESAFAWSRHWIETGFEAYEATIAKDRKTGAFSHGDTPTFADLCLAPQVFNAARFKVDMARYPTIQRIHAACMQHPAFDAAQPSKQPDAEP